MSSACVLSPPLHLFPSQSVWAPIHCFHPAPKPTPLLLPILLYYASSRPPSFSSCSSALDVHTELCRIGFLLLSDLLKKIALHFLHLPPFLTSSLLVLPSFLPLFLLPQYTYLIKLHLHAFCPPVSAPLLSRFTRLPRPPPHLNKSDKIRDCISPLGSPSLKRVSCLRGGTT